MVTEKDLYQNIRIDCRARSTKKEPDDFYIYDMKNNTMVVETTKKRCVGYTPEMLLDHINRGIWKIVSSKVKIYELW
jgi:hypothetical protein